MMTVKKKGARRKKYTVDEEHDEDMVYIVVILVFGLWLGVTMMAERENKRTRIREKTTIDDDVDTILEGDGRHTHGRDKPGALGGSIAIPHS